MRTVDAISRVSYSEGQLSEKDIFLNAQVMLMPKEAMAAHD